MERILERALDKNLVLASEWMDYHPWDIRERNFTLAECFNRSGLRTIILDNLPDTTTAAIFTAQGIKLEDSAVLFGYERKTAMGFLDSKSFFTYLSKLRGRGDMYAAALKLPEIGKGVVRFFFPTQNVSLRQLPMSVQSAEFQDKFRYMAAYNIILPTTKDHPIYNQIVAIRKYRLVFMSELESQTEEKIQKDVNERLQSENYDRTILANLMSKVSDFTFEL